MYPPGLLLPTDRTFLLAFTSALAAQRQIGGENCRVWTGAGLQTDQPLLEVRQKWHRREARGRRSTPPWLLSEGGQRRGGLVHNLHGSRQQRRPGAEPEPTLQQPESQTVKPV